MEDALAQVHFTYLIYIYYSVLILVLMEDALALNRASSFQ